MKAIALVIALALAGCATREVIPPEPKVLVKIERVVAPLPRDLLDIPDQVPNLPPEALKDDATFAKWLLDSEQRTLALEAQIRQLRALYIQQLREAKAKNEKEGGKSPSAPAPAASASK